MIEAIGAELADLGPIGLLVLFVTLTGVSGSSIYGLIRSRTRAGRLATEKAGLEAALENERHDRLVAERRAERAEAERDAASPSASAEQLDRLRGQGKLDQWAETSGQEFTRFLDVGEVMHSQLAVKIGSASGVNKIDELVTDCNGLAKGIYLIGGKQSAHLRLVMECERLDGFKDLFESNSTSEPYLSSPGAAEADIERLRGIAATLYARKLSYCARYTMMRAVAIMQRHGSAVVEQLHCLVYNDLANTAIGFDNDLARISLKRASELVGDAPEPRWREHGRLAIKRLKGRLATDARNYDEADRILSEGLPAARILFGKNSEEILHYMVDLSWARARSANADPVFAKEVVELCSRHFGYDAQDCLASRNAYRWTLWTVGRADEAIAEGRKILPLIRKYEGEKSAGWMILVSELTAWSVAMKQKDR